MAKGKKTGGRRKGTPNKATAEVKAYASQYTTECVDALMTIVRTRKEPAIARVMAAREVLDRGNGKPPQALTGPDGEALTIPTTVTFVYTKAPGADARD